MILLNRYYGKALKAVAFAINDRPRKSVGWKTPAEVFNERLTFLQQVGVVTTD